MSAQPVAAAVQIGMLAAARPGPDAAEEVLRLMDRVIPSDASCLLATADVGCTQVAVRNYPDEVTRTLATEFPRSEYMVRVLQAPVPPSISTEPDQAFRRSALYQSVLRPNGFRDGMSGHLVHHGRSVGTVHLSAEHEVFGEVGRHLLAALLPALAKLVDTRDRLVGGVRVPVDARAAVVRDGWIADVPGHARPLVLEDDAFRRLLATFSGPPGSRLRGLWPGRGTWSNVAMELLETGVLVYTTETDPPHDLSTREVEILSCLALGMSNAAIADFLCISPRTVHSHVDSVLRKTGTASRSEAAALARRDSLIRPLANAPGGLRGFVQAP